MTKLLAWNVRRGHDYRIFRGTRVLIKVLVLLFGMIWVRATLPRLRYDRLMAFGWKLLLPLAIVNVLIVAFGIILNMELGVTLFFIPITSLVVMIGSISWVGWKLYRR